MNITAVAIYCLAAILPVPLTAQGGSRTSAKVEIVAFDAHGRFLGAPNVTDFESDNHKNLASKFRSGAADDIPFGVYRIEGHLPAYSSEVRYVRIYQPHVTVILGLTIGFELPEVPPILHGRIVGPVVSPPKSFVKLIGIYSNVSMESLIDSDGNFSLGGLTEGRFLVLVVGEKGLLASRVISIPYSGPVLEIDIARDRVVPQ